MGRKQIKGAAPIHVGILHSIHGTMALGETSLRDVLLMEIDRVNQEGGLLGQQVVPIALDPGSDWMAYRDLAHELIHKHHVAAIFGCWTSASRKSVLPVVEEADALLFYPVQYEGDELSRNIFYLGATPNQQAIPALEYLMSSAGGGFERFFFLGTDYLYPRTTNRLLKLFLQAKGFDAENFPERYVPFGHSDWRADMLALREFASEGRGALISTLNGDSNLSFYQALRREGFRAHDLPTMAFSISEAELQLLDPDDVIGHFACCSYFMSNPSRENLAFVKRWTKNQSMERPVYDAMVSTLIGFRMWRKAVSMAGTVETAPVRQYLYGQSEISLTGKTCTMSVNHHLNHSSFVGRANASRQFDIVWESPRAIPGDPFAAATIIADTRAASAQRAFLEALPTPLIVVGDDCEVRYRTPSTHRYFGDVIDERQILEIRAAARAWDRDRPTDIRIVDTKGRTCHMTVASRDLLFDGESAHLLSLADVTHIREIEEKLRVVNGELHQLATTDSLTSISNRRHFLDRVHETLAQMRSVGQQGSIFMLDVDSFKGINDKFGHEFGDTVLVEIANALRGAFREGDIFGRLGGDEFAGLLIDCDITHSFAVLDRLRLQLASIRVNTRDEIVSFTCSIGMCTLEPDDFAENALKRADEALYRAKETGRNRVFVGPSSAAVP